MEIAKVVPISKAKERNELSNYRLISILSFFPKNIRTDNP